jgi:hypothetical protein
MVDREPKRLFYHLAPEWSAVASDGHHQGREPPEQVAIQKPEPSAAVDVARLRGPHPRVAIRQRTKQGQLVAEVIGSLVDRRIDPRGSEAPYEARAHVSAGVPVHLQEGTGEERHVFRKPALGLGRVRLDPHGQVTEFRGTEKSGLFRANHPAEIEPR